MHGGTFVAPLTINGRINLGFTIDSVASSVVIPADVFMTLIRSGTTNDGDLTGKRIFQLADGSTQSQDSFLRGIVTLPCGERKASAAQELSGGCERGPPRVHCRGAKHAVRLG